MARKQLDPETRRITADEIARQIAQLNARDRELTDRLAALFAERPKGVSAPAPALSPAETAIQKRAIEIAAKIGIDGVAAPPAAASSEAEIEEEREAVRRVIKILSAREFEARVADAVEWAEKNSAAWTALCREIVLAAVRLNALELRAEQMLSDGLHGHNVAIPMGRPLGNGPWLVAKDSPMGTLEQLIVEAVREGIITERDVEEASNV